MGSYATESLFGKAFKGGGIWLASSGRLIDSKALYLRFSIRSPTTIKSRSIQAASEIGFFSHLRVSSVLEAGISSLNRACLSAIGE